MNQKTLTAHTEPLVMFVDMNSFFASCEQQENYWLRGRPVAVCVYTNKNGCIISPSIEAKKKGIKLGIRLDEAMKICPDLVPLETKPSRYRDFHVKFIKVLQKYSQDVIPKSIDEAMINFHQYKYVYNDLEVVAKKIKDDIKNEVGDWLQCSIGIAPNAFLAKLASDIQKPNGLTTIKPENIDEVLKKLTLQDLPGIGRGMAERFQRAGIYTPLDIRYATAEKLKRACQSIVGVHWHYRLNFAEVDIEASAYKSMQAMRHLSKDQRRSLDTVNQIILSQCQTLEKRMVQNSVHAGSFFASISYINGQHWKQKIRLSNPVQDGQEMLSILHLMMKKYEEANKCDPLINTSISGFGIGVCNFVPDEAIAFDLFDNRKKKDVLRKAVYGIKGKYGGDSLVRASELQGEPVLKDVIGFGSIKDLHEGEDNFSIFAKGPK